jgi:hypothetical protein
VSKFKSSTQLKKKIVVMKESILVYSGKAASGRINGKEFSILCTDEKSCEFVWSLLMDIKLDPEQIQNVVLCREADIETDVTPAKLSMVKS